jgi:class 3 adenylate cyclase
MLFVDVRGSTTLAEQMSTQEFSQLMNRFYEAAIAVLVQADAFIDKLVGDEVTALFIPGFAGPGTPARLVEAGRTCCGHRVRRPAAGHGCRSGWESIPAWPG